MDEDEIKWLEITPFELMCFVLNTKCRAKHKPWKKSMFSLNFVNKIYGVKNSQKRIRIYDSCLKFGTKMQFLRNSIKDDLYLNPNQLDFLDRPNLYF